MKTCLLLLSCVLAGALALPNPVPVGKDPRLGGSRPLPEGRKQDVPTPRSGVLACGSHVIAEGCSQVIESPNHPSDYPINVDCTYTLTTDTGKDVQLSCDAFNLEYASSCGFDWLEVNGIKFCGLVAPVNFSAPQLDVGFHSDYSIVYTGFRCAVTLIEPAAVVPAGSTLNCGTSRLDRGQYTVTDGTGDYSNYVDCYYQLYTEQEGDQLSISCPTFDVESQSSCVFDWLSVEGTRYCGSSGPAGVSAVGHMVLHWHTNTAVVRPGFVCTVTVVEVPPTTTTVVPWDGSAAASQWPSSRGRRIAAAATAAP